jgi:hypothetical protein
MQKKLVTTFILTAILSAGLTKAAIANPPLKGGTCWANLGNKATLDPGTQITCDIIGKVTAPQIYEKGFRIVTMTHNPQNPSFVTLIIEEQR